MDWGEIATFISTIGFPAAMAILMWRALRDEQDAHRQEAQALAQSINANTNAITELTTYIRGTRE